MRQFRYWFGFGILLISLIALMQVKEKLEGFLDSARQKSRFNFVYLGYQDFLGQILREFGKENDSTHKLKALSAALTSGDITLSELMQRVRSDIGVTCGEDLKCSDKWVQSLYEIDKSYAAQFESLPNTDELKNNLDKELKEQIFLLMPDAQKPPFQFVLQEPLINKDLPVAELTDDQKSLLEYYEQTAFNIVVRDDFQVYKNSPGPMEVADKYCKVPDHSINTKTIKITAADSRETVKEKFDKSLLSSETIIVPLELFYQSDLFEEALRQRPDTRLKVAMSGPVPWIYFNFMRISSEKLNALYIQFGNRVEFVDFGEDVCNLPRKDSLGRMVDWFYKGHKNHSWPLFRQKGYDEMSELSLFLY